MATKLDDLLPAIIAAKDAGLTVGTIRKKFVGKSTKAKNRSAELQERLASLVRDGAIWGPIKYARSQHYFAAGCGPSIETASQSVEQLVLQSGVKLLSKASLEKKVTGMHARFLADGIKHAVANRAIVELVCGSSKYYLHREVASDYFDLGGDPADVSTLQQSLAPNANEPKLSFDDLLPVYHRLRAEQGGFSAVKIFDLIRSLQRSKDVVHQLLIDEAKAGRVTIHHTTSVELSPEVVNAGIRLQGFAEPFITVVVKDDR
jgi:hypothetical protein